MLKDILSISGKPGLYKLVSNASNAMIVESLLDGKRMATYSTTKVISLKDISIYTENDDMPLKEVFKRILDREKGAKALSHKEDASKITAYFGEVVPEYDKARVYLSDLKKMLQWYNLLVEKGIVTEVLKEEKTEEEGEEAK